jgi:hypothetical protein
MKLFQLKSIMIRKNDFWKTPLNMFMFTPTNFNFDSWLYFSIHPIFIFITCCMFYIIASTVKVILKPILFPLNLYQTFFLPVIFSVHLKVSFVHLFTGVVYFKSKIFSRAFKCRLFLTCTLYLSYDIFHDKYLRAFKCLLLFTCILSSNITYHYVFVYTT